MFEDAFVTALKDVMLHTSDTALCEQNGQDGHGDGLYQVTGMMNLSGERRGMLIISADRDDMRRICSRMTGVPTGEVQDEDIADAACELVNMTAGNAKLHISNDGISLSTPYALEGDNMRIITKKRDRVVSVPLSDGEISLLLKIIWKG